MKKNLLLLTILLCIISNTNAQEYAFGIKGGVNNNTIGTLYQPAYNNDPEIYNKPNKEIGYQIGTYFAVEFGSFFVRPEINYVTLKNNYELPRKKSNWRSSKIDVPVLFGLKIFKPMYVYAGPSFNFYNETTLDGVQPGVTIYSDGGPDLDRRTVNFNIGVMFRYNRFGIDLRYEKVTSNNYIQDPFKNPNEDELDIVYSEYGTNLANLKPYKPTMLRLSIFIDIIRTDETKLSDIFKGKDNCGCPY